MHSLMMPETRSKSEIMDEKTGAKGPVDHNYIKMSNKSKQSTPSQKVQQCLFEKCNSCLKPFERQQKKLRCGFCESPYCNQCLDLTRNVFEALTTIENASWYCNHCAHAVPGVQKLLIRVGNIEEKCEALNKRVESLENKSCVSPDTVKDLVSEEVAELKEIESRKLNLICLNLPESKRSDVGERQQENLEFLNNLLENKMNLVPDVITVNKLVRLGRRENNLDGTVKCRPLRFTVDVFDQKRQILKANSLLRNCENDIFNNIYFTPDLTKIQRKRAFDLRAERRLREEQGERNLKISRGKIIVMKENRSGGFFRGGTASGGGPSEA